MVCIALVSLILLIVVCSILSTILYVPSKNVKIENYIDGTDNSILLMIKEYAYDMYSLQHFYSFSSTEDTWAYDLQKTLTPKFFAIDGACSNEPNYIDKLRCYSYNINPVSVVNKNLYGITTCSSIDNVVQSQDPRSSSVLIGNDVYTMMKNCIVSTIERKILSQEIPTTKRYKPTTSDGISDFAKKEAYNQALKNRQTDKMEGNTSYALMIVDEDTKRFFLLARPLFLKVGTSALYYIDYTDNDDSVYNCINSYKGDTRSLQVRLIQVCDSKLYESNNDSVVSIDKAVNLLAIGDTDVDCKPAEVLDISSSFTYQKYLKTREEEKAQYVQQETTTSSSVSLDVNMMVYYLTYTDTLSNVAQPRCISLFFENPTFMTEQRSIFTFPSFGYVDISMNSTNYRFEIGNFGKMSSNVFYISQQFSKDIKILLTWSLNRLNFVLFYTSKGEKQFMFKSIKTPEECQISSALALNKYCLTNNCNVPGKQATCFISIYDFAKSKSLI